MTTLETTVQSWIDHQKEEGYTSALSDLMEHGCQSGMVSRTSSTTPTPQPFTKSIKRKFGSCLDGLLDDTGLERTQDLLRDWDGVRQALGKRNTQSKPAGLVRI